MKYTLIALAFALAASTAFAAETAPTLSANGEGTEMAVPDIAVVTIGVSSRARTAGEALAANNTEMEKVIAAIRGENIKDIDIGTTGFAVNPVYSNPPPQPDGTSDQPQVIGYEVSNSVRVLIRDLNNTGKVLDRAINAGANQVGSINFQVDKPQPFRDKALASAIADAQRKGELMAEASGVRLVRILTVSASDGPQPMFDAVAYRAEAVPIMAGQQTIAASATITWEIAPR